MVSQATVEIGSEVRCDIDFLEIDMRNNSTPPPPSIPTLPSKAPVRGGKMQLCVQVLIRLDMLQVRSGQDSSGQVE